MPYEKQNGNKPVSSNENFVPAWLRWMKRLPLLRRLRIAKRWRARAQKLADRADWICPETGEMDGDRA